MKYIFQLGFICFLSFIAELLHEVIPLPVPASVYGLVLLFLLLCLKVVKVEQIETVSGFFISVMPIFFISPSVSLITSFGAMKGSVLSLVVIIVISTVFTLGLTGVVTQFVMRRRGNHSKEDA